MDLQQQRLQFLASKGFRPRVILDIGAHTAEWAYMAHNAFPGAAIVMYEANDDHRQALVQTPFKFFMEVLGNEDGKEVNFYSIAAGPYSTGDSMFRENTHHYRDDNCIIKKLKMRTLDVHLKENNIKKVDFIKMDVQGAELMILEGAQETLKDCEVVLLEAQVLEYNKGAPMVAEVIATLDKYNFTLHDIFGFHYMPKSGLLNQLDLLFVKKDSKLIPQGEIK